MVTTTRQTQMTTTTYYEALINLLVKNDILPGGDDGKARNIGSIFYLISIDQGADFIQIGLRAKGLKEEIYGIKKRLLVEELRASYSPDALLEAVCENMFIDLFESMIRSNSITFIEVPNWLSLRKKIRHRLSVNSNFSI